MASDFTGQVRPTAWGIGPALARAAAAQFDRAAGAGCEGARWRSMPTGLSPLGVGRSVQHAVPSGCRFYQPVEARPLVASFGAADTVVDEFLDNPPASRFAC